MADPPFVTARERTLVVGASGYLGRAVAAECRRAGHDVVGTCRSEPTVEADAAFDFWTDDLAELLDGVGTVVFAAHVEGGDDGRSLEAFERAARRVATTCADRRVVYVSSDAVFDGKRGRYREDDPRTPTTPYGRRLAAFEDAVRETCSDHCVVRPSYVFGFSAGRLDDRLTRTRDRVTAGERVEYWDDYYRSPIAVGELATAIRTLAEGDATGVVHAGGPRTSVYRFHRDAMAALGYPTDPIGPTAMPPDADHPRDTSLRSDRLGDLTGIRPSSVSEALDGDG